MNNPQLLIACLLFCLGCSSFKKEIKDHRTHYKEDFLKDPRSPLKTEDLENLDFYPPSGTFRVGAKFTLTRDEQPFELPTYSGITRTYRKWGNAKFLWQTDSVSLALYENLTLISNPLYKDYLFLPFKDETNSVSTYGGGRYLNMSKADTQDGMVTIDFNKSYKPWCAYSEGFNCPIPPKENHLEFPIHAGEKKYKGEVKHH